MMISKFPIMMTIIKVMLRRIDNDNNDDNDMNDD